MAKGTLLGRGPGFLRLSQKTAEQTASALRRGCSRRPGWLGPGPRAAFEKSPCPGQLVGSPEPGAGPCGAAVRTGQTGGRSNMPDLTPAPFPHL